MSPLIFNLNHFFQFPKNGNIGFFHDGGPYSCRNKSTDLQSRDVPHERVKEVINSYRQHI